MREGVGRNGRHLYPAFPYTSFTKMSDADLQALYAWLMAAIPVKSTGPETRLPFPFNLRPMLAGWNAMYLKAGAMREAPNQSAVWNRGAYLVESIGHCSACHAPRDALGGERRKGDPFAGGSADGWDAPALGRASPAPVRWDSQAFFDYLRHGSSDVHGPAAGPMVPVIEGLAVLPDEDIRAMALYLASLDPAAGDPRLGTATANIIRETTETSRNRHEAPDARLFEGACAVCHAPGGPELFGRKWPLGLNSNVHAGRPDNLIRIILDGSAAIDSRHGAMPAFRHTLTDQQIASIVAYVRQTYAPTRSELTEVEARVAQLRRHYP